MWRTGELGGDDPITFGLCERTVPSQVEDDR